MRTSQPAHLRDAPGRKRPRVSAALVLTVTMGLLSAFIAPAAAEAVAGPTDLNAITSVSIEAGNPDEPITVWQQFKVVATWELPAGAQPGDTFSLNFPGPVVGFAANFVLNDANGVAVGTCAVTDTTFLCTLNDYVRTHTAVRGSLFFYAQADEAIDSNVVVFMTGVGSVKNVQVPGGSIEVGAAGPPPTVPVKWGWLNRDGTTLTWQVVIPSEFLAPVDGTDIMLTDVYDPRLTLVDDSVEASWIAKTDWNVTGTTSVPRGTTPGTFALTPTPAAHSFTAVFNQPTSDGTRLYILEYQTLVPADAQEGDLFTNTISGRGQAFQTWPVQYVTAGGAASGIADVTSGSLSVTKSVTGSGASAVPTDTAFTVAYSYLAAGVPVNGTLSVKNGAKTSVTGIPTGTVVTLSELAAAPIDGVTFAAPKFSGTDVSVSGASATVTIGDGTTVEVLLENAVTAVAVPPVVVPPVVIPPVVVPPVVLPPVVPPVLPTQPNRPLVPAVPETPADAAISAKPAILASTGADALPLGIGILALLLVGSGLLVVGRRRTRVGRAGTSTASE